MNGPVMSNANLVHVVSGMETPWFAEVSALSADLEDAWQPMQ